MAEENVRPWGRYDILHETEGSKTKIIKINPKQRFSLQYHNKRDEYWVIVKGSGIVTLGILEKKVSVKDIVKIPKKMAHRAQAYDSGLEFIEVQIGEVDENDIVRLEDDYGRVEKDGKS